MRADVPGSLDALSLRVYSWLVTPVGLFIAAWGVAWVHGPLNGLPYGIHSLVRMTGVAIAAAGLTAAGLARLSEPRDRRHALRWFFAGHMVVLGMAAIQRIAIWPAGPADWLIRGLVLASLWLFYALVRVESDSLFQQFALLAHDAGPEPRLRSRYEEEIRRAAAQEERNRLARDLHDSVKQQLFVVQTSAATAQARLGHDAAGAAEALVQVRDGAREAMAEMEAMTDQLRATPLENTGLVEALRKQAEALGFRTGAQVEFTPGPLPANEAVMPGSQQALFRVAQEALANVARHARATRVRVSLAADQRQVVLEVEDDGPGLDPKGDYSGSGLANMRARAKEFGGTLSLTSRDGRGTVVRFAVPYATVDLADCRTKMLVSAAGTILILALVTLMRRPELAVLALLGAFDLVRYAVAFRRARQLEVRAA